MKNTNKVVMVIIGTLIGAGFASGREIFLFFMKYGYLGQLGIILSSLITGIIIYFVLKIEKKERVNQYSELLTTINPTYKKLNQCLHGIVNAFLVISFFIMVAGFCAYMEQVYRLPTYLSSTFFVLFCYLIFQKSLQGMTKINHYLVPLLLCLILYLGIKNIPYLIESKAILEIQTKQTGFFLSSLLYASYNSIILIPVLITMRPYIETEKQSKGIAIQSSMIMMLLSFCIYGLLLKGQFYIQELELPLLEVTLQFGKGYQYLYGFVIVISIFTSAISAGYSFLENVSKNEKQYKRNLQLICLFGILISNIGFSSLVQILYPLFGGLGMIQILFICYYNYHKNKITGIALSKRLERSSSLK